MQQLFTESVDHGPKSYQALKELQLQRTLGCSLKVVSQGVAAVQKFRVTYY